MTFLRWSQHFFRVGMSCCDTLRYFGSGKRYFCLKAIAYCRYFNIFDFLMLVGKKISILYPSVEEFGSKQGLDEVNQMGVEVFFVFVKAFEVG